MGTEHETEIKKNHSTNKHVEVELGFTKSMGEGSYEFIRVDIRHTDDVGEDETHVDTEERLYRTLEERLVIRVKELDEALGPRGRASKIHANKRK